MLGLSVHLGVYGHRKQTQSLLKLEKLGEDWDAVAALVETQNSSAETVSAKTGKKMNPDLSVGLIESLYKKISIDEVKPRATAIIATLYSMTEV
jgi:hypothetical protein